MKPAELRHRWELGRVPAAMLLATLGEIMAEIGHPGVANLVRDQPSYIACHEALERGDVETAWAKAVDVWLIALKFRELRGELDAFAAHIPRLMGDGGSV